MSEKIVGKTRKPLPIFFLFFLTVVLGLTGVSVIGVIFARKRFFDWLERRFPVETNGVAP